MTYSNFGTHVRFAKSLEDLIKNHNSIESILLLFHSTTTSGCKNP
jgi:hypothetical protein